MQKNDYIFQWWQKNGIDFAIKNTERWVCLQLKTGDEFKVANLLFKKNIVFFLPVYKDLTKEIKCLFPGYIFSRINIYDEDFLRKHSIKCLYTSVPHGEQRLVMELKKFSNSYEIELLFKKGDQVFIDAFNFGSGSIKGTILETEKNGKDIIIDLPFFQRETRISIAKNFLRHIDRPQYTLKESEIKIISNSPISEQTNQNVKIPLEIILNNVDSELIKFLKNNPAYLYKLHSRKFEELVAALLKDMGYEIELLPETHDGGRDIIAIMTLPPNRKVLTLVECKRYSPHRKIGIDILERFLWVLNQKYDTNGGLIATTSFFSEDARKIQESHKYKLNLHDFNDMKVWLNNYGSWKKNDSGSLWIPNEKFTLLT